VSVIPFRWHPRLAFRSFFLADRWSINPLPKFRIDNELLEVRALRSDPSSWV